MENKNSQFLKSALNHGLIFGVILVIIQLITWMVNFMPIGIGKGLISLLVYLILYVVALYWFTKTYRNSVRGGFLNYGEAYLYAFTVFMIATLITAVYSFVFNSFIDPEYTSRVVKATADWTENYMRSKGVPEATISSSLEKITAKAIPTPISAAIKSIWGGAIFGAIVSLISAAFAKKVEEPFKEN